MAMPAGPGPDPGASDGRSMPVLDLRVAMDLTPVITGSTGVARYARHLSNALTHAGVTLLPYAIGRATYPVPPGVRHIRVPLRLAHRLWATVGWPPIDSVAPRADLVHTLDLVAPPVRRPSVATVHDLDAIERPDLHSPRSVSAQRAQLSSLDRVQIVLANSETTRRALGRHGIDPERVVVGRLGLAPLPTVDPAVFPGVDRYVLCVGSLDVRKGQDILIRAAGKVPELTVVLAGPDGWRAEEIRSAAQRMGDRVRVLGPVDDARLASLYRGAAAVCVPSRAEGFGLVIIEAMSAGVPIVASDLEATREVGGEVVVFVPPDDPDALAAALAAATVPSDGRELGGRAEAGRVRAAAFTWEATAEATIAAYRRALG